MNITFEEYKTALAIQKTNPEMESGIAIEYAKSYELNERLKLPIIYNCPDKMYDVTGASEESNNPSYRYYVKGREW